MMSCSAAPVNAYRGSTFTSRGVRDLAGKRTSAVATPLPSRRTGLQVSAKGKGGGRRSGQSSGRPGGQPSMYVLTVRRSRTLRIHEPRDVPPSPTLPICALIHR
jgi:hypothetical protein